MRQSCFPGWAVSLAFLIGASAWASEIDPALQRFRSGTQIVIALMESPQQGIALPRRNNGPDVVRFLKQRSQMSWKKVEPFLVSQSNAIKPLQLYSVVNGFAAQVTPEGLSQLSRTPGIEKIVANEKIEWIKPVHSKPVARSLLRGNDMPYGFKDIGLDRLMAEHPEINGKGVKLGVLDTGASGDHPALANRFSGFFDCETNQKSNNPKDYSDHGTHVSGTMVGKNEVNLRIGVAPEAKIEVSGSRLRFSGVAQILAGMDHMLDPDGNPATADMPRAVNNSWGWPRSMSTDPAVEMFYKAVTAWEAAGILPVFAAGNERNAGTIRYPGSHPSVLTIGATGPDGKIAPFSSQGPGEFRNTQTQKPEITAPGVDIVSSTPGGGFGQMSGTSMASPHVTGSVGLVLQVNPSLTPAQIKELLISTAQSVETQRQNTWNPVYGFGKLNIYAAVKKAMQLSQRRRSFALFHLPAEFSEKQNLKPEERFIPLEEFDRYPTI